MSIKDVIEKPESAHVTMMAPHQRDRHAGKLIIEATERILILEQFVASLLNPEENGYAVTGHVRDQARMLLGEKPCEVKPPNDAAHQAQPPEKQ